MTAMEDQLAALLDREAIRDLPGRYCDCVWRDDFDGVGALFTDDGVFTVVLEGREVRIAGRRELVDFFSTASDFEPRPYIHNHVVDLCGDGTAHGRCYLDLRSARLAMEWVGAGYYEDEYVKQDGVWRFRSRRFHALYMKDMPERFRAR